MSTVELVVSVLAIVIGLSGAAMLVSMLYEIRLKAQRRKIMEQILNMKARNQWK